MSKKMYRQGGWLASFVVVATVLVLGLLGTVYYLKTRQNQTQDVASNDSSQKTDATNSSNHDKKAASDDVNNAKPQTADTNTDGGVVQKSQDKTYPAKASESETSTPQSAALPATGPRDILTSSAVVTILGYSVASYLASRRRASL